MIITFILPAGGGATLSGGVRMIAEYADRLQVRGNEVRLIAPRWHPRSFRQYLRMLLMAGKRSQHSLALGHLGRQQLDVRILDRSSAVTARDIPDGDVVIATWWATAEWIAQLPHSKGTKVHFVQGHEVFPHLPRERVARTYTLPVHRIVVSRWLKETMESLYGDDDVSLVMNPVDLNQFNACQRTKKDPTTVGFLYTRSPRKNVALAVSALEKARSRVPGLRAVAFGAHEPNKELPLPSWIEFHHRPPQSRIPDLYAACDAWLFTSESEGFGLPILEAMACRTPVLATAAGAAPEIVDETNGMLLPSDADAFAAAIIEFASMSAERWRTLSDNALAQARRHEWSDAVAQFEAALHYAMSKSASHSPTIE